MLLNYVKVYVLNWIKFQKIIQYLIFIIILSYN